MAMTFSTKVLDLAGGPVDLTADPDVAAMIAAAPEGARVFVQNVSPRAKVFYAEQAAAPARSHRGHCMLVGDGFALRFAPGAPAGAWVWAASTGTVAVSAAD